MWIRRRRLLLATRRWWSSTLDLPSDLSGGTTFRIGKEESNKHATAAAAVDSHWSGGSFIRSFVCLFNKSKCNSVWKCVWLDRARALVWWGYKVDEEDDDESSRRLSLCLIVPRPSTMFLIYSRRCCCCYTRPVTWLGLDLLLFLPPPHTPIFCSLSSSSAAASSSLSCPDGPFSIYHRYN